MSIAPLALVIGATAAGAGVPVVADMAAAATVFAGAAHLAGLTLLIAGAGALTALGTAVLINARLLLYSASIEPRFRGQPRWFRWLGPALLIDQTYLLVEAREDLDDPARFRHYWRAAGGLLLGCWVTTVGLGSVLGPLLPPGSPLDAAAVVVLAGMLAPRLKARRPAAVALTALVVPSSPVAAGRCRRCWAGSSRASLVGAAARSGAAMSTRRWRSCSRWVSCPWVFRVAAITLLPAYAAAGGGAAAARPRGARGVGRDGGGGARGRRGVARPGVRLPVLLGAVVTGHSSGAGAGSSPGDGGPGHGVAAQRL